MKNLPLFVTLGIVTLMGACNAVNSGTPSVEENSAADSSVIIESPAEETTAEGIELEVEEPTLEAEMQEIPVVDGSTETELEDSTIMGSETELEDSTIMGSEEDAEVDAIEAVETTDPNGDVILPANETVEIPSEEEAADAEAVDPLEAPQE